MPSMTAEKAAVLLRQEAVAQTDADQRRARANEALRQIIDVDRSMSQTQLAKAVGMSTSQLQRRITDARIAAGASKGSRP